MCLIENRDNETCRLAQHIALIEKELAQITALERSQAESRQISVEVRERQRQWGVKWI